MVREKPTFESEAALCTAFADWARRGGNSRQTWTVYPETGGFDMLLVDEGGRQLGVEAKLRMNAKVCVQALPNRHSDFRTGPDWRGILVPEVNDDLAELIRLQGLVVFTAYRFNRYTDGRAPEPDFNPALYTADMLHDTWFDWNPQKRCELPPMVPNVPAGVPSPVKLTMWKVGALKVLAHIEAHGSITAREVRSYGVDPRRFCSVDGWLTAIGEGKWKRGKVPEFDKQHPAEYAEIREQIAKRLAA